MYNFRWYYHSWLLLMVHLTVIICHGWSERKDTVSLNSYISNANQLLLANVILVKSSYHLTKLLLVNLILVKSSYHWPQPHKCLLICPVNFNLGTIVVISYSDQNGKKQKNHSLSLQHCISESAIMDQICQLWRVSHHTFSRSLLFSEAMSHPLCFCC